MVLAQLAQNWKKIKFLYHMQYILLLRSPSSERSISENQGYKYSEEAGQVKQGPGGWRWRLWAGTCSTELDPV